MVPADPSALDGALAGALAAWPVSPRGLSRVPQGLNNDSFFVSAREGEFVLRVYRNTSAHERVRYEHELLAKLAGQGLPFAVPTPARTRAGDTLAVLETEEGPRLAALFVRIGGEPAAVDRRSAHLAGAALARLDGALARVELPVRPPSALGDVHPLVPDPLAAVDGLGLDPAARAAVRAALERVLTEHGAIAGALPRQIVHGDFAYPNLLVDHGRATGLLDFEFAGPDVRAADLACAMYVTVVRGSERERWELLDALAASYRRVLALDPVEIAALPSLLLRRCAIGAVHWMGRWRQGIVDVEAARERPRRLVGFVRWLEAASPRLVLVASGEGMPRRP